MNKKKLKSFEPNDILYTYNSVIKKYYNKICKNVNIYVFIYIINMNR